MKTCRVCKVEKELTEFHFDKNTKGGYSNKCKKCTHIHNNARRATLEGKAILREYSQRPEVMERNRLFSKSPEQIKKRKERDKTRSGTEKRKEHMRKVNSQPKRKKYLRTFALKKYEMTIDSFNDLLKSQGNVCAICGTDTPNSRCVNFHVDHDHLCCDRSGSCGKCVRGLLCARCNKGLGNFNDDIKLLINAANYLQSYMSKKQSG